MSIALEFTDVVVRREGRNIIDHVTWQVDDDQRWVILGPADRALRTRLHEVQKLHSREGRDRPADGPAVGHDTSIPRRLRDFEWFGRE